MATGDPDDDAARALAASPLFADPRSRRRPVADEHPTFAAARFIAAEADRITVSTATGHGRRHLHTFELSDPDPAGDRHWLVATPLARGQRGALAQRRQGKSFMAAARELIGQRRFGMNAQGRLDEHTGPVHLAAGVDVAPEILCVILDAHHQQGRRHVDLGDLKVVVSHLGSHIRKLADLDPEQRQHALSALYSEILRRCTTL